MKNADMWYVAERHAGNVVILMVLVGLGALGGRWACGGKASPTEKES